MDNVSMVERLRSTEEREAQKQRSEGNQAGREWAGRFATKKELRRLENFRRECGSSWEALFDPEQAEANQFGPAESLVFTLRPKDEGDLDAAAAFWEEALGPDEKAVEDLPFVQGFFEGALERWLEVKDQV